MKKALTQTAFDTAVIVLFLILIGAPPLGCILSSHEEWSHTEKRVLAPFPKVSLNYDTLRQLPRGVENYYNDHFGFRDALIRRYHREMKKRFGQSGVPNVITGKDDWYFYAGDLVLDDFRGLVPLTENQLISWREDLVRKRDWLARQGIRYLFVLVPDKQTIYPEYLPDYFQKAKGTTRIEQLVECLKQDPDSEILDLKPNLLAAKSEGRLYQKTDTHWNEYGAFVGYREIMHKLSNWFPREKFRLDFFFHRDRVTEQPGGDLTRMLGQSETIKERQPVLKERHFCAQPMELSVDVENWGRLKDTEPFMKGCQDAHLRALVFRDSFFVLLEPFFSENFQQVVYLWQDYDQKVAERLIDYFHPQLVIEERKERLAFRAILGTRTAR